MKTIIISNTI